MEEKRLDLRIQDDDRIKEIKRTSEILYKLNNTKPFTEEYNEIISDLFKGKIGDNTFVQGPLYLNIADNISIGSNCSINPYFKCMSAGKIIIDDYVQIAMNVSIVTNNHDFYDRAVLTIQDVHIKRNAWIGTGSIILPGVTIGENAIVGAGSIVTKDVPDNCIVVGNPAKIIRTLDKDEFKN